MTSDLDLFRREAEHFVAEHYGRRADQSATGPVAVIPERAPAVEQLELAEAVAWRRTAFDAGFGWIDGPLEYGGRAQPPEYADAYRAVERQFAVPDEGYTRFSVGIFCPTLLAHGSEQLRASYLRRLRRADLVACQLFSEPDAGSDLASVRTRAEPDGEDWRVTGQKVWTSGAHYSDVGMLLARTRPNTRRSAGLTVFLIDMRQPGVEVRPIRQLTGGSSFSEVFLDGAVVRGDHVLGEVDLGWDVISTTLLHERAVIGSDGAVDLALIPRLVQLARDHGRWDDPAVRRAVAEVYVRAQANALMTLDFLDRGDHGLPGPEMSLSKLLLTDNLQRMSEVAQSVLGESLVVDVGDEAFGWSQLPLTLPGLRIGGGTDEVLRSIVAQRVLGLPRG